MSGISAKPLSLNECLTRLAAAGVPVEEPWFCDSPDEARDTVRRQGGDGPWVVKAGGLIHKSDSGGVVIGLAGADAVAAAGRRLTDELGPAAFPLLVQRQRDGVEVLVGLRRDPGIGAVVTVGMGGIHTEILRDLAVGLVPQSPDDARALLAGLGGWPLLAGHRGSEPVDVDALSKLIAAVSDFAEFNPDIVEADLNPVIVGPPGTGAVGVDVRMASGVDARHPVGRSDDIRRAMDPEHVVVVGVSDDPGKVGARVYDHLLRHGFEGRVDAIHPAGGTVRGRTRLRSLDEVPGSPDLVCVAVPAARVRQVAEAAVRRRAGALLVHSAGFAEVGPEGRRLQEELVEVARSGGVPLLGPNSMGLVAPGRGLAASLAGTLSLDSLKPGGISLLSTSGALSSCLASRLWERGGGVANWITLGNEVDVDLPTYLRWLADDEETTTVGLLLEHLTDGPRFMAAARAVVDGGKPMFAYNMARTEQGRSAAVSHTGAMIGRHIIREQVLAAAGVVTVRSLSELEDVLLQSERLRLPAGPRLGVITGSGGACAIIADEAARVELDLPPFPDATVAALKAILPGFASVANPLDVTAHVLDHPETFGPVVEASLAAEAFDALLVQFTTNADPNAEVTARQVIAARRQAPIPVYVSRYGGQSIAPRGVEQYADAGVPLMDTPERAVTTIAALVRAARLTAGQ